MLLLVLCIFLYYKICKEKKQLKLFILQLYTNLPNLVAIVFILINTVFTEFLTLSLGSKITNISSV